MMNEVDVTCTELGQDIGVITADHAYLANDAVDPLGPERVIAPGRGKMLHTKLTSPAERMAQKLEDREN